MTAPVHGPAPAGDPAGAEAAPEPQGAGRLGPVLVRLAKLAVAGGLIGLLVWRGAVDLGKIRAVLSQPGFVALILLLGAFNLSTSAVRWRLLLHGEGIACSLGLALRLTWIGHFWNMVVPGAVSGDGMKMYYIGRAAPAKREEAWATVFADRVIGMAALVSLSNVATLLDVHFMTSRPELEVTAAIMFALFLGMVGLFAGLALGVGRNTTVAESLRRRLPVLDTLRRAYHSLLRLGRRPGLVAATYAISFFSQSMAVVLAVVIARACGEQQLSYMKYCVIVPVALFVNVIPITPGGIGQGETALSHLVEWSGGAASDGLTIMVLYRAMFYVLAGVGALLYVLHRGDAHAAPPASKTPL